jgi:hypothetical protein
MVKVVKIVFESEIYRGSCVGRPRTDGSRVTVTYLERDAFDSREVTFDRIGWNPFVTRDPLRFEQP